MLCQSMLSALLAQHAAHPALEHADRLKAENFLAELQAALPPGAFHAALAMPGEQVLAELAAEMLRTQG